MESKKYNRIMKWSIILIFLVIILLQIFGLMALKGNLPQFGSASALRCFSITIFMGIIFIPVFLSMEDEGRQNQQKAYVDISGIQNKRAAEEKLDELERTGNTMGVGLIMLDLNNLKMVNDLYGHERGDDLIQSFAELLARGVRKDDFVARCGGDEFLIAMENTTSAEIEHVIKRLRSDAEQYNRNRKIHISFAAGYAYSSEDEYLMISEMKTVADRRMYENKKIMKAARFALSEERDSVTGLLTNEAFQNNAACLMAAASEGSRHVLVCADMSNFRFVNDNFGYTKGNLLLKEAADKIQTIPGVVCTARSFSDNFLFLLDTTGISIEKVTAFLSETSDEMNQKVHSKYSGCNVSVNMGIYEIRGDERNIEDMINRANTARKMAKSTFPHIIVYSDQLEEKERMQAEILSGFNEALENEEFEVYLQPQISTEDEKLYGAEVLVRWVRDGKVYLMPDQFIPLLEHTGDILELDYYMYRKSLEWLAYFRSRYHTDINISLNVSRIHLNEPDVLIKKLTKLINDYQIPPSCLTFEITESAYINNEAAARDVIRRLHELGLKASMDDFGSGYSSLKALRDIEFDEIKIDREFISGGINEKSSIVIREVIHMLKNLDKTVVCEGVEYQEDMDFLRSEHCDVVQGYYISRPEPVEEFEEKYTKML